MLTSQAVGGAKSTVKQLPKKTKAAGITVNTENALRASHFQMSVLSRGLIYGVGWLFFQCDSHSQRACWLQEFECTRVKTQYIVDMALVLALFFWGGGELIPGRLSLGINRFVYLKMDGRSSALIFLLPANGKYVCTGMPYVDQSICRV